MAGLTVVHDTAGRLRLRLPADSRSGGVEQALQQHPGVVSCTWSSLTRSVLIHYQARATSSQALIDALVAHTGALPGAPDKAASARPAGPAPPSAMARAVGQAASELNTSVARLTGGAMDLRVLLPLALGAWALREVIRGRAGPIAWSTALWYAHGLFRDYGLSKGEG